MVAHCSMTRTGEVKIHYTGEEATKPKTENMQRVSAIMETNKGRESNFSRTGSYWYGTCLANRSWKKYRKSQTKDMLDRHSPRLVEAVTEEELEREFGYLY